MGNRDCTLDIHVVKIILGNKVMTLKKTNHTVYDVKYHLVWAPKYRKKILNFDIYRRVKELFHEIAIQFNFDIDRCAFAKDHVHILISFPPRYSIANVVSILKSISGSRIFEEFPEIREMISNKHFWERGYFSQTVGDHVTEDIVRKYFDQHSSSHDQLDMFE